MILASHAIFSAYGFWLPNDGRGSWSTEVWAPELQPFGPATKTSERRSLAHRRHDRALRVEAKQHLKCPPVKFDGEQARAIARGFAEIIEKIGLVVYACAIMPDHVHLVPKRHPRLTIEEIVGFLKRAATRELTREGIHPLREFPNEDGTLHTPWVIGGWNRFLDTDEKVVGAIDYVWKNPDKIGLPRQPWWFISGFPGWVPTWKTTRASTSRGRDG